MPLLGTFSLVAYQLLVNFFSFLLFSLAETLKLSTWVMILIAICEVN